MKNVVNAAFLVAATAGCCTIMEKTSYTIPLDCSVPNTQVKVYSGIVGIDGNAVSGPGHLVDTVTTPASINVSSRTSDSYSFLFESENGMPDVEYRIANVSPWMLGNIVFLFGAPIGMLVDSLTGADRPYSEEPIYVNRGVMDFRSEKAKEENKTSFQIPKEEENVIEPLTADALIGKWVSKYTTDMRITVGGGISNDTAGESTEFNTVAMYLFRHDGTYRYEETVNDCMLPVETGQWRYSNGIISLSNSERSVKKRILWLANDKFAIRGMTPDDDAQLLLNRREFRETTKHFPEASFSASCEYDSMGVMRASVKMRNALCTIISEYKASPAHYLRSGDPIIDVDSITNKLYKIETLERMKDDGFSYRFSLAMHVEHGETLDAFNYIKREFRAAVKRDYLDTYPDAKEDSIFVDFPEYRLNNGKIEGRAVVLTIAVASLNYDPNTRTGRLAVRVNANQYEEARKWIRKNIETLARDKNIALTTGEIPPAAKFYLGREELKDGNVLEIEFRTE